MIESSVDQIAKIRDSERDGPIFRTLTQCLFVCYSMEVVRESPRSPLLALIENANDGQNAEVVSLSGVNFSGMTEQEKYAQGVFVREKVEELLSKKELGYILARFSWTHHKGNGIVLMAAYLNKEDIARRDRTYWRLMSLAIFAPPEMEQRYKFNTYSISREFGLSTRQVQYDLVKCKRCIDKLKRSAYKKLGDYFISHGVVRNLS